jgi:hypothetical protein
MRPLRYSINVTADRLCDHRVMVADEDLHRHVVSIDALIVVPRDRMPSAAMAWLRATALQ